jgi:hypothetical protein
VPQKAASMYYMVKLHIRSGKNFNYSGGTTVGISFLWRNDMTPLARKILERNE